MIEKKMTPEEIADTCERAAELVEAGWQQGDWYSPPYMNRWGETFPARYCVEGALGAALGLPVTRFDSAAVSRLRLCPAYLAVAATVHRRNSLGIVGHYLPSWNDNTTHQEVLDVLHETAKRVLGVEP